MKNLSKLFFVVLVITLLGCSNDDEKNLVNPYSSVTNTGLLNGMITSYLAGSIDSLAYYFDERLGNGVVASNGYFAFTLPIPRILHNTNVSGIVSSDASSLISTIIEGFNAYKNGEIIGLCRKCNYTTTYPIIAGMRESVFVYVDKSITLKGEISDVKTINGYTNDYSSTYNLVLVKGWNELVKEVVVYSSNSVGETESYNYSNIITAELKWVFIASDK